MDISTGVDPSYWVMPPLHFASALIWAFSAATWTLNTHLNGRLQSNALQWIMGSVPWIKTLQQTLSFLFWYSCFYSKICSLWLSFGVYITGVVFQTTALVSFFLISHGYCITCHRISLADRRKMAGLGCFFYYTLVGYTASVPFFSILLVFNYVMTFYVVLSHITKNIILLREQLRFIQDEDMVYTKYIMFKKFQTVIHVVIALELARVVNLDGSLDSYWIRFMVREWGLFLILIYIGWIFRSQELVPRFNEIPILKQPKVLPIYSIEMDAQSYREFTKCEWRIGVPTLQQKGGSEDSVLVVIRQPHCCNSTA